MINIVNILFGFISIFLRYMFYQCYFNKKKFFDSKNTLLVLGGIGIFESVIKISNDNSVINLLVSTLVVFSICIIIFDEKFIAKLLISFIVILFTIILESAIVISLNFFLMFDQFILHDNESINIIINFIESFILYIIVKQIRVKRLKKLITGDNAFYVKLLIIPILSFILLVIFYYSELASNEFNYFQYYLIVIFLLVINTMHLIIYENSEKLNQENYENLLLKQKYEQMEEYYNKVEQHQEEIRRIKHDLKNQLIRIDAYDNNCSSKEIKLIIDDLEKKDRISFTKNIGINLLLYVKYKEAIEKNIKCKFNIKLPELINIDDRDLTVIIGNIIDNAIEACEKCISDKYICIDIIYYSNMLTIHIINSTDGLVKDLKTRKKNIYEHGLGIKSIQLIVDKYNGNMKYTIEENAFIVDINIWVPIYC